MDFVEYADVHFSIGDTKYLKSRRSTRMIQERILELVKYGLTTGLVGKEDEVYTINRLLELFKVDDIEDETFEKAADLPDWTQDEAEEQT